MNQVCYFSTYFLSLIFILNFMGHSTQLVKDSIHLFHGTNNFLSNFSSHVLVLLVSLRCHTLAHAPPIQLGRIRPIALADELVTTPWRHDSRMSAHTSAFRSKANSLCSP